VLSSVADRQQMVSSTSVTRAHLVDCVAQTIGAEKVVVVKSTLLLGNANQTIRAHPQDSYLLRTQGFEKRFILLLVNLNRSVRIMKRVETSKDKH